MCIQLRGRNRWVFFPSGIKNGEHNIVLHLHYTCTTSPAVQWVSAGWQKSQELQEFAHNPDIAPTTEYRSVCVPRVIPCETRCAQTKQRATAGALTAGSKTREKGKQWLLETAPSTFKRLMIWDLSLSGNLIPCGVSSWMLLINTSECN